MRTQQTKQHNEFKAAKNIALMIEKGCMRRAKLQKIPTNYCGYKANDGRMWVIGDSDAEIQNPDAIINGKPAREVYEENYKTIQK